MSTAPKLDDCDRVLVVEGYGDLLFFAEVLEHLEIEDVFIKQFNGASDLVTKLETFLSPGLLAQKKSIAVILDADENASSRIQSLKNVFQRIAHRQIDHGLWSAGQPNLGYFVVPDGSQQGEIESLVWQAWSADPDNDSQKSCIESYLDCMRLAGYDSQSPAKGKISTLLAVRYDDDPRLGPGARAKIFDFDLPEFHPLCHFFCTF